MKSSKEIALDFAEVFQSNYPKKPLRVMMDNLAKEIDKREEALEKQVVELEAIKKNDDACYRKIFADKIELRKALEEVNIVRRDKFIYLEVFGMSIALPRDKHSQALLWQESKALAEGKEK